MYLQILFTKVNLIPSANISMQNQLHINIVIYKLEQTVLFNRSLPKSCDK